MFTFARYRLVLQPLDTFTLPAYPGNTNTVRHKSCPEAPDRFPRNFQAFERRKEAMWPLHPGGNQKMCSWGPQKRSQDRRATCPQPLFWHASTRKTRMQNLYRTLLGQYLSGLWHALSPYCLCLRLRRDVSSLPLSVCAGVRTPRSRRCKPSPRPGADPAPVRPGATMRWTAYYTPDDLLLLHLVLIGPGLDWLPYFIFTFEELGRAEPWTRQRALPAGEFCSLRRTGDRRLYWSLTTV